ncbi:hypothetical protein OIU77_017723 [Salix suchowensis]|uniref:Uncharacterized protein n=1 Tax=Salix suchowensis TaxID=1278906 RepID=A0ABQ8ZQ78_9ROSI|nr:hypothetical protein OIU77_017723 [Salix suchowensis]
MLYAFLRTGRLARSLAHGSNCSEVYSQESEFDHHFNFLQLLYIVIDGSLGSLRHGCEDCPWHSACMRQQSLTNCYRVLNYLKAMPWEESEEEEIPKIIREGIMLNKLVIMEEFVNSWVDASDELVQVVEQARSEAIITEKTSKVVEMAAKVMYRSNRIWHWYSSSCYTASLGGDLAPFVRISKALIVSDTTNAEDAPVHGCKQKVEDPLGTL